jgi:hypothetical protein
MKTASRFDFSPPASVTSTSCKVALQVKIHPPNTFGLAKFGINAMF